MATKKTFNFPLGATVSVVHTARSGEIIGRAQYSRSNPSYLLELPGNHGSMVHEWFDEESLVKAGERVAKRDPVDDVSGG